MSRLPADLHWAGHAFAEAALGAQRRTMRGIELAAALAQPPTASWPEACGDGAMRKGASRVLSNDAVEPPDLLPRHIEATYGRLAPVPLVVAVQATTAVDWTSHPATNGWGPLGHRACQGLPVPSTLAVTPARGPLGLLAQQVWARDPSEIGTRARRTQRPIGQQDSQQWLTSLDAVCRAPAECPQTRFGRVGEREAEVFARLVAARPESVALRMRASGDRCVTAPERYVWATVAAPPVVAALLWPVPRRGPQPGRAATLALRDCPVTRCPPRQRQREGVSEGALWAVQVGDIAPPTAVEPIAWRLLTTVAVQTVADAIARVEWYACRWGSEVWQRMLQSGCRIAARQWATAERLQRCLPLHSVIAWRVF
jgi:Transposase DNA-binding